MRTRQTAGAEIQTWYAPVDGRQQVSVAVKHRLRGDDLIMFTHGLGCAKESFDGAFEAAELRPYSLFAFDFPAHGGSGEMPSGADIAGLVGADCGLVSRGIAHQSAESFDRAGFAAHVGSLAASSDPSLNRWAQWYARCRPQGIHEIARSLVEWCDSDKLINIFLGTAAKAYIHGERSDVDHLVGRLRNTSVRSVPAAGHFPMVDNPASFYALVAELIGGRQPGISAVSGRPSL